ncbi:MAG: DUF4139 domain-containing protein [Bacteroidota bacterium]
MNRKYFVKPAVSLLAGLLLFSYPIDVHSQQSGAGKVSLTVYNADLGVVRDVRNMTIKQGQSEIALTDVAQLIDPTSVHIKLDGEVIEQNYQYDLVNLEKILQKYIDQDIELIGEKEEVISGKLLSSYGGQLVLQKKEGGLVMLTDLSKYRVSVNKLPEGLITRPTLLWLVNSRISKPQDVEISYQTQGLNWHAEYVAVLNENDTKLDLKAWVSIENRSGMSFNDASLKLVAGDVNLMSQKTAGYGMENVRMQKMDMAMAQPQFQEKEFFEYHMYDLNRKADLKNNETKQISLFDAQNVAVTKKYLYRNAPRLYGGESGTGKISVVVEFENKETNNLGIPIPKGTARVYKSDGSSVEFIGEDQIDHTPKDEKIKLKIGNAFDLVAEEVQTDSKRISTKVHEETYEIKLKNRKKENVSIDVERYLGTGWEIIDSSLEYKKKDAQNITFSVPVKAGKEVSLIYRVRYSY